MDIWNNGFKAEAMYRHWAFDDGKAQAVTHPQKARESLQNLFIYIHDTFCHGKIFLIKNICPLLCSLQHSPHINPNDITDWKEKIGLDKMYLYKSCI